MAHMDTVFAKGAAAARPFRIEGGRAYGPGVSDDKGGIVAAIALLTILNDLKFKDYARITLLLNSNEETGSRGTPRPDREARQRARRRAQSRSRPAPATGITIWRKGSGTITVEVKGRASHAGGQPEFGPQRGDGAGPSDAPAQQARRHPQGHHDQFHRAARPATART